MFETQNDVPGKKLTPVENAGRLFGEYILLPTLDLISNKIEQFTITSEGLENLSQIQGQPCLFVSNHLKPVSAIAEQSQLSPDAFVIQHVVRQAIGVSPRIVAKAGDGWWSPNALYRTFQEKALPAQSEALKAAGFIPVNKNPGSLNRELLNSVEQVVKHGDSILIFPEGHWYQDFSVHHPLSGGAAFLAMKHALPIVPIYIHGAHNWKRGQEVYIAFGKSFASLSEGTEGRQQTTEAIRSAIAQLQSNFSS